MTNHIFTIPEFSLLLLVGPSGSGKSSFAEKHFLPTEVVSSDECRGMICDDENNQACSGDAFDLVTFIVRKRLKYGKFTVVDATNVGSKNRRKLLQLARQFYGETIAVVFDLPLKECHENNIQRQNRVVPENIICQQYERLQASLDHLKSQENINHTLVLKTRHEINTMVICKKPSFIHKLQEIGPFDIIGDIHGCFDELMTLLEKLGYERHPDTFVTHPEKRKLVFVGDLVDRGPKNPEVLDFVMGVVQRGLGFCVCGNHDDKLRRKLLGRDVKINNGLEDTLSQLENYPPAFITSIKEFLENLPHHLILDQGRLVVSHAGILEKYIGHDTPSIRSFCLYGRTTGQIDEFGYPVRYPWAKDYQGKPMIIYGHTPVGKAEWVNGTMNIDTGCVYGHQLTALRYPEGAIVSVPSLKQYYPSKRPLVLD